MLKTNELLRRETLDIVDNQIRDRTPPETRETYHRLKREGYSDAKARELIGAVVTSEVFEVLKQRRPYDETRYIAALHRLPKLTWE